MHVVIVYVLVIVVYPVPETTRGQVLGTRVVRMPRLLVVPCAELVDCSAVVAEMPVIVLEPVVTSGGRLEIVVELTM